MVLDFVAGCLGGVTGVIVGHPFDTVKVKLQAQPGDVSLRKYSGTFDCFRKIFVHESALGFYKGVTSPLASLAFINAIVFGVYGQAIQRFQDPDAVKSQAAAGALAGFAQAVVASPMELAKLRIQLQEEVVSTNKPYKGPLDCLRRVYSTGGAQALFRGLSLTFFRDMTGFAIYFASYETITRYIHRRWDRELNALDHLFAGGMAGSCSWMMNYPIDVIKTRYQSDHHRNESRFYDAGEAESAQKPQNLKSTAAPNSSKSFYSKSLAENCEPSTSRSVFQISHQAESSSGILARFVRISPESATSLYLEPMPVTAMRYNHSNFSTIFDPAIVQESIDRSRTYITSAGPQISSLGIQDQNLQKSDGTHHKQSSSVDSSKHSLHLKKPETSAPSPLSEPAPGQNQAPKPNSSGMKMEESLKHQKPDSSAPSSRVPMSKYANIRDCIMQSYRVEGPRVFVQGLTPTLLRAFPTNAVTFLTVATVYKFFKSNSDEEELIPV